MYVVGVYQAKTNLARIIDDVVGGQTVVITRHGVPVARLVPAGPRASDPGEAVAALRAARQGVRLGRLSVRRMIEEGRR